MNRTWLGSGVLLACALGLSTALAQDRQPQPSTGRVVEGNTKFAIDLYHQLRTKEGNLFYSPFSISTALSMTSAGARGKTLEQMNKALHLTEQKGLHPALAALLKEINGSGAERPYQLSTANALWGQKGMPFRKDFLNLNRAYYGAGLQGVDFENDPEGARRTINAWAQKETNGKIKGLLPRGLLRRSDRLVLTNAIYFKANWVTQFKKELTRFDTFHVSASKKVRVPLMEQTTILGYAEDRAVQVLSMPYKGNDLDMVVILPRKAGELAGVEQGLTADQLSGWLKALTKRRVKVTFPQFKMTRELSLKCELEALGMKDAFDRMDADFSGMTDSKPGLFLAAVVHKAFVEVDERGTKAAAATAGRGKGRVSGVARAPFRADHPFLFLIRDARSGSILFMGRLSNPQGLPVPRSSRS